MFLFPWKRKCFRHPRCLLVNEPSQTPNYSTSSSCHGLWDISFLYQSSLQHYILQKVSFKLCNVVLQTNFVWTLRKFLINACSWQAHVIVYRIRWLPRLIIMIAWITCQHYCLRDVNYLYVLVRIWNEISSVLSKIND